MDSTLLRRIIGAAVFFITLFVYLLTVQSNVSFWDCGEFIASAFLMQVPHPPGTPLWLMMGKLFSMFPIGDNVAFRVNMMSVLSSAFTVYFLYLVVVKLVENYNKGEYKSKFDELGTYVAGAIGALSLAFADTFWFNAIEAEVYAFANFFIAIITWLILVWNEKADEPDNEKYLILIAYLVGLSTGVHLMAVLCSVSIVMIIMFRKFIDNEETLLRTSYIFLGHVGLILLIGAALWSTQTHGSTLPSEEMSSFDMRMVMIFVVASIIFIAIFWKKLFDRNSFYLPIIIGGVVLLSAYPGLLKIPNLLYLVSGDNATVGIITLLILIGIIGYIIYWTQKESKPTLNLAAKCLLFAVIGFTTYTMIPIRSSQDTPINLNSPKTFSSMVSYLDREQYGRHPMFQRRYSQEPHQTGVFTNYDSDLDFLLTYQMNHMFNRYLLWNYVGRESTVQDSGVNFWELLGIPFLIGLFGIFYHFKRDWKMGAVFLVMFVFLGWLMAYYQNQQQPQPRERDYFYVGAFFVFSVWIGLGIRGIIDVIKETFSGQKLLNPLIAVIMVAGFVAVPANMLLNNFWENDRTKNYLPWDYSYNLLQSVAPNAIIFTNGDNDTFPLWYLQDVEGVRRDVRVANLSLLNTAWYIYQLRDTEPHGAEKIKMSLSDVELDNITPVRWETTRINLPVPDTLLAQYNLPDSISSISWDMPPGAMFGQIGAARVQDLVALDIVRENAWIRPVYFSVTTAESSQLGMNDYLQMEGLAFRVVPKKNPSQYYVNAEIMGKQIFEEPEYYEYSKDYQPGFKFRGINDPTLFLDDNHKRLSRNYRNAFVRYALHNLYIDRDFDKAVKALDAMEEKIPRNIIPIDYRLLHDIGQMYFQAGAEEKYNEIILDVEKAALEDIARNPSNLGGRYSPYLVLLELYENSEQYGKALDILLRIQQLVPNDPSVQQRIDLIKKIMNADTSEVNKNEIDIEQ